jgi:dTDP-4-dehydrorhamnose reductase
MKLLVIGGSGFLGWNAVRHFERRGDEVVKTFRWLPHYLHKPDDRPPVRLDLADGAAIRETVARFQPDLLIHTAALARPQIDTDPDELERINAGATAELARAADAIDAPIVYISTDFVFPPDSGRCNELSPVVRSSEAAPYALSKLHGEQAVQALARRWIIIRPSVMFGISPPDRNCFTQFIDSQWRAGRPVPLFTDQIRSFLYAPDLCRAIEIAAIERRQWNEIFVCGGAEDLDRAEFGLRYADARGVDRSMCRAMPAAELEGYRGGASDIRLDCRKLRSLGWRPTPLEQAFDEMISEDVDWESLRSAD